MKSSPPKPKPKPKPLCADFVHETAISYLDDDLGVDILDIPCGEGALLARLYEAGRTSLHGADINVDQVMVRDIASIKFADVTKKIGEEDGAFGVVFCIECIEHIENPFHLVRELARVTKSGGKVIISTPNVLSTNARSKYLSAGYFPHFKELSTDWEALRGMGFQGHVSPIPLHKLLFLAESAGLDFCEVKTNKFKRSPGLKDKALAAVIRLVSKRHYKNEKLLSVLTSDTVLFGDVLIACFQKK